MTDQLRFHLTATFFVFALCCFCVPAHAQSQAQRTTEISSDNRPVPIIKLKLKGVTDFGEVTPTLYRGSQASPEGIRNLKEMGIDIFVDLRGNKHRDRMRVEQLGMQYVPVGGLCFPQSDKKYAKFLSVIDDHPGKKIYVECRLGNDRTGMAIASFRMANQGWTPDQAMEEMHVYGFTAIHHVMCPFLARYEQHFPHTYATHPAFAEDRGLFPPPASWSVASKQ